MSMNEQEARQRLREYLEFLQGDIGYSLSSSWLSAKSELRELANGDWLASYPEVPRKGVLLKSDGTTFPFFGALGKLVPLLGWPASREYFLASASHGRYQYYDGGLAIWEAFEGAGDIGYPVAKWESIDQRAKSCQALIAVFDLRRFTKWSESQDAKRIQDVIEMVEQSFQDSFSRRWCKRLFAKGTGDGFLVVSEVGWYAVGAKTSEGEFQAGHTKAFCRACAETVRSAKAKIPDELAIGCGITIGQITQLYLLGRFDYIGPSVNEASKIQAIAHNELCMSTEVVGHLQKDGVAVEGNVLPGKGIRVSAEVFSSPEGPDDPESR
jgi:class 3 adenylate cyclase